MLSDLSQSVTVYKQHENPRVTLTQSLDWEGCNPANSKQTRAAMVAHLMLRTMLRCQSAQFCQGPLFLPDKTPDSPGPSGLSTCPWASTIILSEPRTVCRRWAIVSIVQSANASLTVSWISKSVSVSMAAVASSRIKTCQGKKEKRKKKMRKRGI